MGDLLDFSDDEFAPIGDVGDQTLSFEQEEISRLEELPTNFQVPESFDFFAFPASPAGLPAPLAFGDQLAALSPAAPARLPAPLAPLSPASPDSQEFRDEISRLQAALAEAEAARAAAEATLQLLREKTKEKFLRLKEENEALKRGGPGGEDLRGERDFLEERLALVSAERSELADAASRLRRNETVLLRKIADMEISSSSFEPARDGAITLSVETSAGIFGFAEKSRKMFNLEISPLPTLQEELRAAAAAESHRAHEEFGILKDSLTQEISRLMDEIASFPKCAPATEVAAPTMTLVEPPPLSPWALERDRLREAVRAAEDELALDRAASSADRRELQELREARTLINATEDTTKVIYAKNIFSNLLNLAPDGPPEFEQLLSVLATFFGVSSVALESRRARQQTSRGFFVF